jgi:Family of unknown function (DUF5946)
MNPNQESADQCAGCGLAVPGGRAGCQSIMDELLALHFSDATYFGVHRLFVDTYCLPHPGQYCVSFKSLAAHLAHLCWSLEHQAEQSRARRFDIGWSVILILKDRWFPRAEGC